MYRPNRIGPWPFVDIDAAMSDVADTTLEAIEALLTANPEIYAGSVSADVRANNFRVTGSLGISAGDGLGIGVQVLGTELVTRNSILSVAGSVIGHVATAGFVPSFVVGRTQDTGSPYELDRWAILAPDFALPSNAAGAQFQAYINRSLVLGDWIPSGNDSSDPIVFGVMFRNSFGGALALTDVNVSLSCQRYVSDLQVFDPNR